MKSIEIKKANSNHKLIDQITNRWSPRSFDAQPILQDELDTILEAASWAASAGNEQPWIYYFAHRNSASFQRLWDCFSEGNQPWTKNASVLMVACVRKTFEKTGKHNNSAEHDLGMANAQLLLQAIEHNIYGHLMGGFDRHKASEALSLDENLHPVCMIALGRIADAELLEEPFLSRELTPRQRKSLAEISFEVK